MTATLSTIPALSSLDEVTAHPLSSVVYSGKEATHPCRFSFANTVCEDCADDEDVLSMAALFIADGIPFTLTIDEPIDEDAIAAEEAQYRRDLRDLWAAHGPGR